MTELLVGTKKGLFVLRGEPGEPFDIATRAFPGDVVEFGTRDPRTGRYFASVTSGFYGPRLMYTDDPTGDWEQANGPTFPDDIPETSLDRIWIVQPGEADGVLYAGVAPAALFTSTDSGATWELNRALWNVPTRPEWNPGAGGLALHSICPWPGDPQRLAVGISAAGVWLSEDGGRVVAHRLHRIGPAVRAGGPAGDHARPLRAQHASLAAAARATVPAVPRQRLPVRRHRRDMERHRGGLPSGFGFPWWSTRPIPDNAYVIPLRPTSTGSRPRGRCASSRHGTRATGGPRGATACRRGMPTSRSSGRRSGTTAGRRSGCTSAPRRATCSARRTRAPRGSRSTNAWRP